MNARVAMLGRGLPSTTMKPVMTIAAISATPNTPKVRCKEYFPFRMSSAWVSSNAGHAVNSAPCT